MPKTAETNSSDAPVLSAHFDEAMDQEIQWLESHAKQGAMEAVSILILIASLTKERDAAIETNHILSGALKR